MPLKPSSGCHPIFCNISTLYEHLGRLCRIPAISVSMVDLKFRILESGGGTASLVLMTACKKCLGPLLP